MDQTKIALLFKGPTRTRIFEIKSGELLNGYHLPNATEERQIVTYLEHNR
ncbi:MAG: hypothetical protein KC964_21800 [Candidatus Omnitrophica bacterium]|nr:hypothetical protein [Candidatus Omnitrophota bacterium]